MTGDWIKGKGQEGRILSSHALPVTHPRTFHHKNTFDAAALDFNV